MLFGQEIEISTDHSNLTRGALGRWRPLVEVFCPEIMYNKGIDNTVADAVSGFDCDPSQNPHADDKDSIEYSEEEKWSTFITVFNCYDTKSSETFMTIMDKYTLKQRARQIMRLSITSGYVLCWDKCSVYIKDFPR